MKWAALSAAVILAGCASEPEPEPDIGTVKAAAVAEHVCEPLARYADAPPKPGLDGRFVVFYWDRVSSGSPSRASMSTQQMDDADHDLYAAFSGRTHNEWLPNMALQMANCLDGVDPQPVVNAVERWDQPVDETGRIGNRNRRVRIRWDTRLDHPFCPRHEDQQGCLLIDVDRR